MERITAYVADHASADAYFDSILDQCLLAEFSED